MKVLTAFIPYSTLKEAFQNLSIQILYLNKNFHLIELLGSIFSEYSKFANYLVVAKLKILLKSFAAFNQAYSR